MEPEDHLFRREAGRMVATLTRIFGVHNLALAEDVVQDAFCRASAPRAPSRQSWMPGDPCRALAENKENAPGSG